MGKIRMKIRMRMMKIRMMMKMMRKNHLPGVSKAVGRLSVFGSRLSVVEQCNSVKFNLVGSPWSNHGAGLHARSLLVHLFAAALNLGFQIVASADVSSKFAVDGDGKPDYPLDVHSIYLVKMPMQDKLEQNLLPTIHSKSENVGGFWYSA